MNQEENNEEMKKESNDTLLQADLHNEEMKKKKMGLNA